MVARILVVDDDPSVCRLLETELARCGFQAWAVGSAAEALRQLDLLEPDVLLTDVLMEGTDGLQLCGQIASHRPDVPVVVMTAADRLETAIGAIRAGAYDFITKPIDFEVLGAALRRAAQHRGLVATVDRLRRAVGDTARFDEIVGTSTAMRRVYTLLERAAESDVSVLITGESGTGKELVARALHRKGRRAKGPLVAVDCSAIPEGLLESELFGHTRGAFTDARADRVGLFVQASGGTLFLDEIGNLPVGLQPKLLRALKECTVRPVGGQAEVPFDVRIIAATKHNLRAAVEEGRFRQDLLLRIAVIHVQVPPLREREDDVLLLAQCFVERAALRAGKQIRGLSPDAVARLQAHAWPGNVRELQSSIERAVALTTRDEIAAADLPEHLRPGLRPPAEEALAPLAEVERLHILGVLDAVRGNRSRAASILGIDRKTLQRKLGRFASESNG